MNYFENLKTNAVKYKSIVCMGMDPVLENIPDKKGSVRDTIFNFYAEILNEITKKKIYPSCVKPNYAFYAAYGFEGLHALYDLIKLYRKEGFPVILDVKRGDIGKTAEAYAAESFDFFEADAVTLSPYLGSDSITPFTEKYPGRGYYILCKTSNKTGPELQNLCTADGEIFCKVAELICKWHVPGVGAVTGATYPEELRTILKILNDNKKEIPLLIPGIGTQGGDLQSIISILSENSDINLHRINASSSINYAYKKMPGLNFAEAAVKEIQNLNDAINVALSRVNK